MLIITSLFYVKNVNQKLIKVLYCKNCYDNETESCNSNRFQQDFDKWTSGNKFIDKLIQE